jgi:hypothetical protein
MHICVYAHTHTYEKYSGVTTHLLPPSFVGLIEGTDRDGSWRKGKSGSYKTGMDGTS